MGREVGRKGKKAKTKRQEEAGSGEQVLPGHPNWHRQARQAKAKENGRVWWQCAGRRKAGWW